MCFLKMDKMHLPSVYSKHSICTFNKVGSNNIGPVMNSNSIKIETFLDQTWFMTAHIWSVLLGIGGKVDINKICRP